MKFGDDADCQQDARQSLRKENMDTHFLNDSDLQSLIVAIVIYRVYSLNKLGENYIHISEATIIIDAG